VAVEVAAVSRFLSLGSCMERQCNWTLKALRLVRCRRKHDRIDVIVN